MLTDLSFENFKAWRASGDIRLAPITVFFGANSAGKTSIPQLLLMLKQTVESSDRKSALQLGDARSLVDLGTFTDVLHNNDLEAALDFTLTWDPTDIALVAGWEDLDEFRFSATIRADGRGQARTAEFSYQASASREFRADVSLSPGKSVGKFKLESQTYELIRNPGRAWELPGPSRFYGFPDEARAYYQNTGFTSDLELQLERLFRSIYYVGPLREQPKRLYHWSGEEPDHVGKLGARAVEAILAAGKRAFNFGKNQKTKPLGALVAERLRTMGLIHEFEVKPLGKNRKEYEVLVRSRASLPFVKLTDVGFGVSQVLPVIVECFYVPNGSIVIFEQPEIHLHPRVQADLADLFVDAIHAREGGKERHCQFIIESHSEHFLRRLQRRIAEGKLSQTDAALYFVSGDEGEATIEGLQLDEFGNIANWPDNFFGDEMADLVARSEAQARAHAKRSKK